MNKADLETFCTGPIDIIDYAIFSNMFFFEEFGQFGNANFHLTKDWKAIKVNDDMFTTFGSKVWDA